jgi:hypothetical protein
MTLAERFFNYRFWTALLFRWILVFMFITSYQTMNILLVYLVSRNVLIWVQNTLSSPFPFKIVIFSIIKHWLFSQRWHWRRKSMTYLASRLGLNGHSNILQGPSTDGDLLCIQLLQNAFIWALMYIQLLTRMLQFYNSARNLWREIMFSKKSTNIFSTFSAFLKTLSHLLYEEAISKTTSFIFTIFVIIVMFSQLPFDDKFRFVKHYFSPNMWVEGVAWGKSFTVAIVKAKCAVVIYLYQRLAQWKNHFMHCSYHKETTHWMLSNL